MLKNSNFYFHHISIKYNCMTVKDTYFCTFHKFRSTVNRIEIISTSLNPRLRKVCKLFQQLNSEKKNLFTLFEGII